MKKENLILSIETAVGGGSISILKDETEIDFWIGEKEVSKSEDVLQQIAVLLEKNKIKKTEINLLTVSNGPGSFTGLRIGFAIALGLKKSLGCDLRDVSVLEALSMSVNQKDSTLCAVPFGRNQISWQEFEFESGDTINNNVAHLSSASSFVERLKIKDYAALILHRHLFDKFKEFLLESEISTHIEIKSEINLARQIGIYGQINKYASDNINVSSQPKYLSII